MSTLSRSHSPRTPIWLVWSVLVATTILAWTDSATTPTTSVVLVVLGLATLKIALVMGVYMEILAAPRWLRATAFSWLTLVIASLTVMLTVPELLVNLAGR